MRPSELGAIELCFFYILCWSDVGFSLKLIGRFGGVRSFLPVGVQISFQRSQVSCVRLQDSSACCYFSPFEEATWSAICLLRLGRAGPEGFIVRNLSRSLMRPLASLGSDSRRART